MFVHNLHSHHCHCYHCHFQRQWGLSWTHFQSLHYQAASLFLCFWYLKMVVQFPNNIKGVAKHCLIHSMRKNYWKGAYCIIKTYPAVCHTKCKSFIAVKFACLLLCLCNVIQFDIENFLRDVKLGSKNLSYRPSLLYRRVFISRTTCTGNYNFIS